MVKLLETLLEWLVSLPLEKIPYDAILDLVNNKMRVRVSPIKQLVHCQTTAASAIKSSIYLIKSLYLLTCKFLVIFFVCDRSINQFVGGFKVLCFFHSQISGLYLSEQVRWVGCQGSSVALRGYPCSLWTLFHVLSVQAANRPDALANTGMSREIRSFFNQKHIGDLISCNCDCR